MKKNSFLFLLSGILFFACSKKSENYVIDIDLKNTGNRPGVAVHEIPDKGIIADTLVPNGNFFRIRGSSDSLAIVSFYLADGRPPFRFYVKNGDRLEIKGDISDPASVRLTGETTNQEVFQFRKQQADKSGIRIYPEGSIFLTPPLQNLPDRIRRELWESAAAFVAEHSASPAAAVVFSEYMLYPPSVRKNDSLILRLGPDAQPSLLMGKIGRFQEKAAAGSAGSMAPPFQLKNNRGRTITSDTISGKPAILSFWSPAENENPWTGHLQQLYRLYRDSVMWINIAVDIDSLRWQNRLTQEELTEGIQVRTPLGWNTPLLQEYGVTALPALFLIGREGKIEAGRLSLEQLKNQLQIKFGKETAGNAANR